jgi:hypothetical protein
MSGLKWGAVLSFALMPFVSIAGPAEGPTIVAVAADGKPIHAIVNAASKIQPNELVRVTDESPLLSSVRFVKPVRQFTIVITGVLVNTHEDGPRYCDLLSQWSSLSKFVGQGSAPTNDRAGVDEPFLLFLKGKNMASGEKVDLAVTDTLVDCYSFKQNRLMKYVRANQPVDEVDLDAPEWADGFQGFFKVQIFSGKPERRKRGLPCESDWRPFRDSCLNGFGIFFENYCAGGIGTEVGPSFYCIGDRLALDVPGIQTTKDFLWPVGLDVKVGNSTDRHLTGLRPGSEVVIEIRGLFVFGAYLPGERGEDLGGGGGLQDAFWRFSWMKTGVPEQIPNSSRVSLKVLDTTGKDIQLVFDEASKKGAAKGHLYHAHFTVPMNGQVVFYQDDCCTEASTANNAGALMIRVENTYSDR